MRYLPFFLVFFILSCSSQKNQQQTIPAAQLFNFEQKLNLPGAPETIFDAATGDISGWWDHTFSKQPVKLFIEPKPGGGFYEIFDESGDGALHATVTAAQRGKLLRFEGAMGLAGKAVTIVHTYEFTPVGQDSTQLHLTVNGCGDFANGLPEIIEQVWHHFLFEQFKPWVESGKHLMEK
ncbi:SRPBCC domain-containing protein [candidate division KSB1 bacterium]|nr:SRPBCC domain-containing protein [candidate division KSB1 bacterium]